MLYSRIHFALAFAFILSMILFSSMFFSSISFCISFISLDSSCFYCTSCEISVVLSESWLTDFVRWLISCVPALLRHFVASSSMFPRFVLQISVSWANSTLVCSFSDSVVFVFCA